MLKSLAQVTATLRAAGKSAVPGALAKSPHLMKRPDRLASRAALVRPLMQGAGLVQGVTAPDIPVLPVTAGWPPP